MIYYYLGGILNPLVTLVCEKLQVSVWKRPVQPLQDPGAVTGDAATEAVPWVNDSPMIKAPKNGYLNVFNLKVNHPKPHQR